ncbi:MAG: ADP-ribosylglycohydrolase family protein [Desulfatibacillaceae bacterium]
MLGAIAGDMVGSVYEGRPVKTTDFPLFLNHSRYTDDSVLTVAVGHAILEDRDYASALREFGQRHPRAGYGGTFIRWLADESMGSYNSWGNGSAMRVSAVGHAWDTVDEVLEQAKRSAEVTHDHPEGIKGAQAVALAVLMARQGADKDGIRREVSERFGYDMSRSLDHIRPGYGFDVSCQGSVPEALIAFLESDDFEGALRNAVSLGGDADTQACVAGAVAQPFYGGVPAAVAEEVGKRLPPDLAEILERFGRRYPSSVR